ncbi:hypothetical protein IID19_04805 [Patescibacteria group bacterium]|nr:hypothetical protein [Patescibacteria group bacterium]
MSDLMLDVDQARELKAAFRRGDWTNALIKRACEGDSLAQFKLVVEGSAEIVHKPHILKRQPFDPEQFLGKGWKIDEQVGNRTGDNLDAGKIVTNDYLRERASSINGEDRLKRIKAATEDIQLDASDFLALWKEKDHVTLKWLYDTRGITWLSFWGTILRGPDGLRHVLYLDRRGGGCRLAP